MVRTAISALSLLFWLASAFAQPTAATACEGVKASIAGEERCLKPGDTFRDCDDCPEMVVVPAGSFMMGSPESEKGLYKNEGPQHKVTIAKPFAAGKFEVTVGEYLACVSANSCRAPEWQERASKYNVETGSDNHYKQLGSALTSDKNPIVGVSWNDARAFAQWLGKRTGQSYRLLSEAEWEYAARAGSPAKVSLGDSAAELGDYAWYGSNSDSKTHSVGTKKPNAFGLHDMYGNV